MIVMSKKAFGLLMAFVFVGTCCTVVWAKDIMRWEPRTPAGGSAIDPDLYFRVVQAVEFGPAGLYYAPQTLVTESGFGRYVVKTGYFELDDAGNAIYFDRAGNRVNPANFDIEDDPTNTPRGVLYMAPTTSSQRRLPLSD